MNQTTKIMRFLFDLWHSITIYVCLFVLYIFVSLERLKMNIEKTVKKIRNKKTL